MVKVWLARSLKTRIAGQSYGKGMAHQVVKDTDSRTEVWLTRSLKTGIAGQRYGKGMFARSLKIGIAGQR